MRYIVEVTENKTVWYKEGTTILHREDGPAVEYADGSKYWYNEGKLHREDGPSIEYADGSKYWYNEGKLHREDGPAVEWADGSTINGWTIEGADGSKYWYLENQNYSEEGYLKKMNPLPTCEGKVVEIDGKKYKLSLV